MTVLGLDKLAEVEETNWLSIQCDVANTAIKRHPHYFTRRLLNIIYMTTRLSATTTLIYFLNQLANEAPHLSGHYCQVHSFTIH